MKIGSVEFKWKKGEGDCIDQTFEIFEMYATNERVWKILLNTRRFFVTFFYIVGKKR